MVFLATLNQERVPYACEELHPLATKKVSLDLKMEKKMKLKGMGKTKRWVLYAPYIDKSMLRNVMGYELARQLGLTAPLTRFVEGLCQR